MSFNATESAFEGFRLARRAPWAILAWALAYMVFFAAFFAVAGSNLIHIVTLAEQVEQSAEPSMSDLATLGRAYGALMVFVLPVSLLFGALLTTAVARAVIRPEARRFGYMRLGKDELRVLAVTLVVGLIMLGVLLAGMALAGVFGGMAASMSAPFLILPAVLAGLATAAVTIWLAVRLSLAVPITFAEQKIAIKQSWTMTKGRFWPLLGMAVLAGVMSMLVALLGSIVAAPLNLMFGGLDRLAGAETANVAVLLAQFWPGLLVWAVVNAILSSAQAAIVYAPFSAAYLGIKGAPRA